MKIIVKDHIIDTSLIKDIQVWGSEKFQDDDNHYLEEIGVFIEYYQDRFTEDKNDLIIVGYVGMDVAGNRENLKECGRIVAFIESHRTKLDYPRFD